jgi:ABC-type lipoprotein release transport system permease subunit
MNIGKLAWKNVWRNTRRSVVTMSAMSLALAALLLLSGGLRGLTQGMERSVVELENGDLQIHAPGYRSKPSIYTGIAAPDAVVATLEAAGFSASARVKASGLAAGAKSSSGVQLVGLDPAHDHKVSRIDEQVREGAWLDANDPKGVVIGGRLAKSLALSVGGEILLLGTASDGSMANAIYRVRGILGQVGDAVDRATVFMTTPALRDLMVLSDTAHQVIVRRPPALAAEEAAKKAKALFPALDVQTWQALLPTVAQILQNQKSSNVLLGFIFYTAVGIVILNAMLMAVFERIRELGVLKAIGMQPGTVFVLILCEGAVQMVLAIAAGVLVAATPLYYFVTSGLDLQVLSGVSVQGVGYATLWKAQVDAAAMLTPIIMLAMATFVAALFPAIRAARLEPIDAIRHQ